MSAIEYKDRATFQSAVTPVKIFVDPGCEWVDFEVHYHQRNAPILSSSVYKRKIC